MKVHWHAELRGAFPEDPILPVIQILAQGHMRVNIGAFEAKLAYCPFQFLGGRFGLLRRQ